MALYYSIVRIYHNLSILLFADIWVVYDLGLQWTVLQLYVPFDEHMYVFMLGVQT